MPLTVHEHAARTKIPTVFARLSSRPAHGRPKRRHQRRKEIVYVQKKRSALG